MNELSIAASGLTEIKLKQVTAKALAKRGKLSKEDVEDLKIYADKYNNMHLAENIINIVTFGVCIIVTTCFYFYLKKH